MARTNDRSTSAKTTSEETLYSISKLAEHFVLDRATVRRRLKDVQPVRATAREKLYRLAEAEEAINTEDEAGYEAARTRKVAAEAARLELKLAQERGELLPTADVREYALKLFKAMQNRVGVRFPREVAPALYKAESEAQITEILQREIARIFNELRSDHTSLL